ncbi:hypothetical protein P5V15_005797 [Pogonomyrmex californicus]
MNSYKKKQSTLEEQEKQERLRLKRKEWFIQQELERKHQERKLKMIEEYEKKRAETIKIDKSRWKASMIFKGPEDIIINEKELHNIKIKINNKGNLLIKDRNMSKEIERDIINPDDIILPRRSNEGSCPIFERNKKKNVEDIQTIKFSQDKQTEKSSTSEKNAHTYKTNLGYDLVTQRYGQIFAKIVTGFSERYSLFDEMKVI